VLRPGEPGQVTGGAGGDRLAADAALAEDLEGAIGGEGARVAIPVAGVHGGHELQEQRADRTLVKQVLHRLGDLAVHAA
jgi:hypothetical protein